MKITLKIAFVFLFLSLLIIRPTPSYAHWHERTYVGVSFSTWPDPYYYGAPYYYPYDYPYSYPYHYYYADPYFNPYYDPYYYPGNTVVSSSSYQPVVVNGVTYYVSNGVYYIYTRYGYQAVATPATEADSFTVNVPNNKGGYTAVFLKKSGNGYIGPQGEYYPEFPKVYQLQKMYGK